MAGELNTLPLGALADGAVEAMGDANLRRAALARYAEIGWPNRRTEAWRYTDLGALTTIPFQLPANDVPVDAAALAPAVPESVRLVATNGIFGEINNDISDYYDISLTNEINFEAVDLKQVESPFAALNAALAPSRLRIRVRRGKGKPPVLHLVYLSAPGAGPVVAHPRLEIEVEAGAEATIIETHAGLAGADSLTNAVAHVTVARDAILRHYKLQNAPADAFHIALTEVAVAQGARYENATLQLGARLARNEIRCRLDGAHGECDLLGAYLVDGRQHLDNTTFIDHAVADCNSRELYKGVLGGRGRGVFQGKILVRPDAQRTNGHQMNRGLLLSPRAEVDSKPELEIYADDVKCSHGATIGELEDDQLFYLQARGIDRAAARRMLVAAYVDEVIDQMSDETARDAFRAASADWMAEHLADNEEMGQ